MGLGEIAVDRSIAATLRDTSFDRRDRFLARESEGLGYEMLLVAEMPIESAVGQARGSHHVGLAYLGEAGTSN